MTAPPTTVTAPHRPWAAGAFRWRLGLRPLDPAAWLELGDDADRLLARKAQVLAEHRATAVALLDARTADEAAEVLEHVLAHLAEHHPERRRTVAPDDHPLVAAARLVPEDLVIMSERGGELVCTGGVVCFPNRWDLAAKLGRSMRAIHAPVARLNAQLAEPIDALLARLRPERGYWRLGWGLIETGELYQPVDGTAPPRPPVPAPRHAGDGIWVRVERETLRRFPRTGAVLFTIRTHLVPVGALGPAADDLARLGAAVAALPPDVAAYKGTDRLAGVLGEWLTSGGSCGQS